MAEIIGQRLDPDDRIARVKWENIKAGDTCVAVHWGGSSDRTVQVFDTLSGSTIAIQGTLGNTDDEYQQLTDPFGNEISFAVPGIDTVTEMVRFIKPVITGGDGSTNATVIMLFKKTI